jgi:uracil-DNA glycosylase
MPSGKQSAASFVPSERTLPVLRDAVQHCQGCDLYRNATQAVFGELETGAKVAKPAVAIMMIGEQPGDQEDRQGRPFVGPAGKLLDRCLEEAQIDRRKVYVTNAVKHFRWEPRGKLRIHKKPSLQEIRACRPWLDAELETVHPRLIVCLGAVAAQALLGANFRITQSHGEIQTVAGLPPILATSHPSAILRAPTSEDRDHGTVLFIEDLRRAAAYAAS